ncbi:hypothetical protein ACN42_g10472 [Penicillium freii]|uniref:Uncharacterized protein n=1 Tax=Penicillium freii TaxID=48697 RepID=A0A124GQ19_PENFR|nr:hypothetical protein ACN42_g10472 [Penicillium freii]
MDLLYTAPVKAVLTALVTTLVPFLTYVVFLSYTPTVDKKSPEFTPNTVLERILLANSTNAGGRELGLMFYDWDLFINQSINQSSINLLQSN